ncbi:MAG: PAS domain-containing protein [Chitinophagaceae bacterium]|nr:PAS domain-containing protein [Chitinophagaceae bacterium]
MQTAVKNHLEITDLKYLPEFAGFLLNNHLDAYVNEQIRLSREINLPLLKFFESLPEERILEIAKATSVEFLNYLAKNKAREQVESALKKWLSNQLPVINKDEIVAEDITLINYVRKQVLLHFIPRYTISVAESVELIKEIDRFILVSETVSTNTYMQLLKNDIREQLHFNEKITDTSPGIIYVFDLLEQKEIYSNKKLEELFGYSREEMQRMGTSVVSQIIHPDDLHNLNDYMKDFSTAQDGEVRSIEYRLKNHKNTYRWLRTYETVFKRNEKGVASQIIGIALDVNDEKETATQLQYREEQLLEAQELAEIGSYEWDIIANTSRQTPELEKILELNKGERLEKFTDYVHIDDQKRVEDALQKAFTETGIYDCEFRYQNKGKEKILWSRGKVLFRDGKAARMNGTIMDVTERNKIFERLQRSEELSKQAEALTHIGNYTWDLVIKKLIWTEELYRIYGLDPVMGEITNDQVAAFHHPDDREHVQANIREAIESFLPFDFYYRIHAADGKMKILHARGEVLVHKENGKAYKLVGTVQDVTEKQTLIRNLKYNEQLYKQAQSIAHLGNWSWDVNQNKIEWTDELYRIYGLTPQTETMEYGRYLSFIHPDDLESVTTTIQACMQTHQSYDFYHRIVLENGTIKTIHSKGEALLDKNGQPYKLVGTAQDETERQTLIQNLQRSDALYKQAQAIAHIGNWTYHFTDKKMTWSDELYRIYGLEPKSTGLTVEEFFQLIHPDDRKAIEKFFEQTAKDPQPFELYHLNQWKDGTVRTLHVKGEVLADEKKNIIGIFGTTQDVTEQQFIEQQLRENQNFIQKIADATPSIIASYNVNTGKYRFVSKGLEQLLGYKPEQVMDSGVSFFADLVHPDDIGPMREKNQKALEIANTLVDEENNTIVEFKYRMRHRNNYYRWFHTFGTIFDRNPEGKVEHVLNISIDITDRMEAEEKILEQEYFIKHIADASPTILYLFDVKSGSVIYINKEIDSALGYIPDEIIALGSQAIPELYHPSDATKMKDRLHEYNDPEHPKSLFQFECRMKHKNGEWRWLLIREIVFKRTVDGKISEVLGAALDITERREIEEKLFHQTIELQQSNKSLEEYAYVASHDLKEPLRKISTFGDRLFTTNLGSLDNEGKNYLEKIISSSKRMQQMINDLLSVSMITGNKEFELFSLKSILDDTVQTLDYKIEENQAIIESDHLPEAYIVPSQFRQLFQNLLSNSLKFIRPGVVPRITVSHKYLTPANVNLYNLTKASRYLQINFEDNGIGFDKQFAEKIFTIFQRLHSRSQYEGTGIGLAICRRITENHGGTIIARSEPDKGAIFTIIIPI